MTKNEFKILTVSIIFLIIALYIFEITDIDVYINNFFFNRKINQWIIPSNNTIFGLILYRGVKILLVSVEISILLIFGLSFKFKNLEDLRYISLFLFTSMAVIPTFVSFLKHTTNIYPPWDLSIYNGNRPYVKLFEKYPSDFTQKKKAQGYPAGHASGGFGILCFFYIFKKRKHKILFLIFWMLLGWSMGIYQMLRGAHFLSHTIASNLISIILTIIIFNLFKHKIRSRSSK